MIVFTYFFIGILATVAIYFGGNYLTDHSDRQSYTDAVPIPSENWWSPITVSDLLIIAFHILIAPFSLAIAIYCWGCILFHVLKKYNVWNKVLFDPQKFFIKEKTNETDR